MPNNDLISRKALLEIYKNWLPQLTKPADAGDRNGVETCIAVLKDAPAVDAELVRRGSWGECRITGYDGLHAVYTRPCSECGHEARFSTNYCPICGAKMDKEKKHEHWKDWEAVREVALALHHE